MQTRNNNEPRGSNLLTVPYTAVTHTTQTHKSRSVTVSQPRPVRVPRNSSSGSWACQEHQCGLTCVRLSPSRYHQNFYLLYRSLMTQINFAASPSLLICYISICGVLYLCPPSAMLYGVFPSPRTPWLYCGTPSSVPINVRRFSTSSVPSYAALILPSRVLKTRDSSNQMLVVHADESPRYQKTSSSSSSSSSTLYEETYWSGCPCVSGAEFVLREVVLASGQRCASLNKEPPSV